MTPVRFTEQIECGVGPSSWRHAGLVSQTSGGWVGAQICPATPSTLNVPKPDSSDVQQGWGSH